MDTQATKEYRSPLTEKLKELSKEGYTADFHLKEGSLQAADKSFNANDLTIIDEFRFEGESNPDDMSILYAIEANDGTKGTVVDAFGTYSDNDLGEFMKGVKEREVKDN
uniref:Phosphoribosylpyrophosphate synthetase n=1 Tax=Roseihalotalea indica TaxID=2867963 RepID=A0AA49GN44_9BACT|nr:hypothetical protein K4G66_31255 [Tunicatimonas sp. TK19036]